jgi:hypothetical protein
MGWLILALILVIAIGAVERTDIGPATRIRNNRLYKGGRRAAFGLGGKLRGRTAVFFKGKRDKAKPESARPVVPLREPPPRRTRPATISYTPPPAPSPSAASADAGGQTGAGGITVDFFEGLLMLVNAPYEGPNDALRQLRSLTEGGRQWDNGLIRLHQRMTDPADMRIDPFVADHVVRAAALGQAMVLELAEADTALTTLLNMTLAEISDRGLQVPNTKR